MSPINRGFVLRTINGARRVVERAQPVGEAEAGDLSGAPLHTERF